MKISDYLLHIILLLMAKYIFFISLLTLLISCNTKIKQSNIASNDMEISQIDLMGNYAIQSPYGANVTVTIADGKRKIISNAMPNHPTGQFPNPGNPNTISTQDKEWEFPITPTMASQPRWAREPGVAVNGVKLEPETAERFVCETGEVYRIEAMEGFLDFGLDDNHAHVQPTGEYHYHGVPTELIKMLDKGEDLVHVAFAADGFPMYYSKSGKYKPSFVLTEESRKGDVCAYNKPNFSKEAEIEGTSPDGVFVSDWTYDASEGDLDECNGIEINGQYLYILTDEYPYIGRCLKGEFSQNGPGGGNRSGGRGGRQGEGGHHHGGHHHSGGDKHEH